MLMLISNTMPRTMMSVHLIFQTLCIADILMIDMSLCLLLTTYAFINRKRNTPGYFQSLSKEFRDLQSSYRFHCLISNLKTLGSLMIFPGTITRPPPPFTSTITRLSSRSLKCQLRTFLISSIGMQFKPVDIV